MIYKKICLQVIIAFIVLTNFNLNAQLPEEIEVKSELFDTGKMWTFDFPPTNYLDETYGFKPNKEWYDDVRLSALRIPGCTASFVSEDGLIMTNNHCSPDHRDKVELEGEDLAKTGFYARTLDEERKVPNLYAEQLSFIVDVTEEINKAIEGIKTNDEKVKVKKETIEELIKKYNEETGLKCQIVSLYNGGKFSIYGYKRFEDVRLVYVPEVSIAEFGGDYDNFTYPRYNLDCAFFRVYDENGSPIKSKSFFKFSDKEIEKNEVIFSVGNPGKTFRLYTIAQLEYYRDFTYRNMAFKYNELYNLLGELKNIHPEKANKFEKKRRKIGNGQKVYHYRWNALLDPYIIARKKDFEEKIKTFVNSKPELSEKYGHIWETIKNLRSELLPLESKFEAYTKSKRFTSAYFDIATKIVEYAEQLQLPENERFAKYKNENIDSLKRTIIPENFDMIYENAHLQIQLEYIKLNLGEDYLLVKNLFDEEDSEKAVQSLLKRSKISSMESLSEFLELPPEEILNSSDPFIQFVVNTKSELPDLKKQIKEIKDTEKIIVSMLGKVLFEMYGTEIPPDANFTLRLSDGVLAPYYYNGTKAITKTTFYGMYNRYYGSNGKYPWNLPERWEKPPVNFDLSTYYNFISTNDITGGNSGSAVINKDAEVVGLAFDGNINSIIGDFIFLPEDNRMISVSSKAIVESLDKVYMADRIVKELKTGKIAK